MQGVVAVHTYAIAVVVHVHSFKCIRLSANRLNYFQGNGKRSPIIRISQGRVAIFIINNVVHPKERCEHWWHIAAALILWRCTKVTEAVVRPSDRSGPTHILLLTRLHQRLCISSNTKDSSVMSAIGGVCMEPAKWCTLCALYQAGSSPSWSNKHWLCSTPAH